jgi:hypothetical protein
MNHYYGWSFAKFDVPHAQPIDGDKVLLHSSREIDCALAGKQNQVARSRMIVKDFISGRYQTEDET